jgi:hypothetical protein
MGRCHDMQNRALPLRLRHRLVTPSTPVRFQRTLRRAFSLSLGFEP